MKDFRGMIDRYLLDHEQQKKYLAIVLALSMLVTFAVPLSLMQNAESTTVKPVFTTQLANAVASDGVEIVEDEAAKVTLLVGANKPEITGSTVEQTLALARSKYLLGIASQFGVFLKGDFTCHRADVESRLAVGGGANLSDKGGLDGEQWGFEIANGDFVTDESLQYLTNNWGYADAIVQGNTFTRIVTQSYDYYKPLGGGDNYVLLDKTFVINTDLIITDYPTYYTYIKQTQSDGSTKFVKSSYTTEPFRKVDEPLIDFEKEFSLMQTRSDKLASINPNGNLYFSKSSNQTGFSYDGTGSDDLTNEYTDNGNWEHWNIGHFVYEGDADETIAYFNISKEQWDILSTKCRYISFEGIPEDANIVVSVGGEEIDFNLTQFTFINGVHISNNNGGKPFNYRGTYISNNDKGNKNNHESCEQLLYNFHDATSLTLYNNIAGNIFAPYAHVNTDKTSGTEASGHLSGALVALSFDGSFEFGYRPYQGTIDLLGSTSGYPIPMSKFKEDGITPLAGAGFTLKKGEEIVESWTSNGGDKPQYITIPTAVDYDGGTNYNTAIKDITTTYTMQEASPPEGYIGTDDQYTITVQEVIDPSGLIKADETSENTIPTKVQVTITVVGPGGDEVLNTTMTVTDTYDTESNQQTRRAIELNGNTYYLDMTNGKITSINKPTEQMIDSSYESNGTVAYTATADAVKQVESYYTVTEEITTEVPVTDENGQIVTDANGETSMMQTQTVVPVTGVETSTVYATDTDNNYVTDENGSTVTETVIVSSSVVTDKILIDSGYTTEYTATKDTTYVVFTSVTSVESVVDPTTVTTSGTITLDGNDYYFDPDSMMLMPVPVPDTVPRFTNRYGYVFEKNDGSEPLSSADMANAVIYLEKKDGENYSQIKQITSSRITLEPDELTENTLYRFNEQTPPSGYEQADPVYMVKSGGKIYWLSSAEEPSVDTVKNSLDNFTITDDNLDNRTIEMKDQKIYGAKVKLQKTDVTGTTKLTGAYFRLLTGNTKVYPVDNWNEGFRIDEELDLFEVLKAAAPESYDENYVQDGYLKKGTYSLEEVTAPGGYQTPAKPYKFKIELDNGNYTIVPLSSDAPEYITFTASTAWGKEIWAYGSATDVTKIEVEVTSPADGSTLILYEDPVKTSLHGKYVSVVGGVATFTEVPNAIGNFKVQNQGYDTGVTVKEVRVYGTASEGGSTATTYTYGQTAWNDNNADTIRISTFTVYYDDGTQEIVENPTHGNQGDHWMPVNISLNKKDGIVGIEIVTTGSGTRKLMIQASDNNTAIYTQDMTAGETYIFGTIPTDSSTDTETDTDDTTQNTESTNSMPLTVTGNTISIPNELMGAKTDITVQKDWEKDELYSSVTRPDKITVQLYQATTQEQMTNNQGTAYGDPVEITPNTDGEWTHTWSQIPNQVTNTDGSVTTYLYYAREVSTPSGYTVLYPDDGKTIIHITNTLNTISLTAHKKWVDSKGNAITSNSIPGVTLPEISVKLQYSENGTDGWKDLPNSTQTLNASNSWTYNYKDIPSGYTYKMVERDVPDGWTVGESTTTNQNNGTVEIENKLQTGSLQVTKKWSGDESDTSTRPGSITVNVYRKEVVNSGTAGDGNTATVTPTDPTDENGEYDQTSDYSRLLQYSLYFYDANMCGTEVADNSAYNWRGNCHTGDEVPGGFHDAGDHAIFGLPQGYTASTLGWSYYEFDDAYKNLGLTTHYRVLMEEFCQFMKASTELNEDEDDVISFLYVKGNGDTDHSYWGAPEAQNNDPRTMYRTSTAASDVAAEYAATLALNYLNFGNEEDLKYAKALFNYAKRVQKVADGDKGSDDFKPHAKFYNSEGWTDDAAWAAAWLYLATDTSGGQSDEYGYKQFCFDNAKFREGYWGYGWNDVSLAALCAKAHITGNWSTVTNHLESKVNLDNPSEYFFQDWWGSARYNASMQMVALVAAKNTTDQTAAAKYSTWAKGQMKYLLGSNPANTCFVTGFASNSPKYPHHRAESGTTSADSTAESKYTLVGALVGGPSSKEGAYTDARNDYNCNEVAIDYNAGLVGAAAGLYSVYGTGTLADSLDDFPEKSGITILYPKSPLTLSNTQSQKASAIKGISVVGSDVKAKATQYELVHTISGSNLSLNTNINFDSNLENISYIEIDVSENFDNGCICLNDDWSGSGKIQFWKTDGKGKITLSSPTTIRMCQLQIWWPNDGSASMSAVRFYKESTGFTITPENNKTEIEESTSLKLTATGGTGTVNWSCNSNIVSFNTTQGNEVTITAGSVATDTDVTITATDSANPANTASVTIRIKPKDFSFSIEPNQIRVNGGEQTVTLNAAPSDSVTFTRSDGVAVEGSTITINPTEEGSVTITAKRGDAEKTAELSFVGDPVITGDDTMNVDEVKAISLNNAIGTVTWEVLQGADVVSINPDTLEVTALKTGTAVVKATDSYDGKYDEFSITVDLFAVDVDTTGMESVGTLTLYANQGWEGTMPNLPLCSPNGNPYKYYIEEVLTDGVVSGNSASYVPIEYLGSGVQLANGSAAAMSVENELKSSTETTGTLPSTGGGGVKIYYAAGLVMMLSGIAGYFVTKRRRNSQS